MVILLSTFAMVVALGIVAIVKLEDEKRMEQFQRLDQRANARFVD